MSLSFLENLEVVGTLSMGCCGMLANTSSDGVRHIDKTSRIIGYTVKNHNHHPVIIPVRRWILVDGKLFWSDVVIRIEHGHTCNVEASDFKLFILHNTRKGDVKRIRGGCLKRSSRGGLDVHIPDYEDRSKYTHDMAEYFVYTPTGAGKKSIHSEGFKTDVITVKDGVVSGVSRWFPILGCYFVPPKVLFAAKQMQ